jgi:hypothetical protein
MAKLAMGRLWPEHRLLLARRRAITEATPIEELPHPAPAAQFPPSAFRRPRTDARQSCRVRAFSASIRTGECRESIPAGKTYHSRLHSPNRRMYHAGARI